METNNSREHSVYDPQFLHDIPYEVIKAAITLEKWATINNHKDWMLAGVASRSFAMKLQSEVKRLRDALEKYSDKNNWVNYSIGEKTKNCLIGPDVAREALNPRKE